MKYTKPPLSIDDQINLLSNRGMVMSDQQRVARYLSHISYFRLRGYWMPFEKRGKGKDHYFKEGTTFDDVLSCLLIIINGRMGIPPCRRSGRRPR